MGMHFYYVQVSPEQVSEFLKTPRQAYEFLASRSRSFSGAPTNSQAVTDLFKRYEPVFKEAALAKGFPSPETREKLEQYRRDLLALSARNADQGIDGPVAGAPELWIEKAWHGIHFLLTGELDSTKSPLGSVVLGGTELKDTSHAMAYGPARLLSPSEVKTAWELLSPITAEDLIRRCKGVKQKLAKKVYSVRDFEDPEDQDYLRYHYLRVRGYFEDAASRGRGMLMYIT